MNRAFVVIALVALGALPVRAAQDNAAPDASLLVRAEGHVRDFAGTRSPRAFEDALLELQAAGAPPPQPGAQRDRVTNTWFALFKALDRARDPAFDPADLPQLSLVPPPDHGRIYPAGVDPLAISDPVARAEYTAALKANHAKAVRYAAQYPLHALDGRATAAFLSYRRAAYAANSADASSFARLLSASGLSAGRRKAIGL